VAPELAAGLVVGGGNFFRGVSAAAPAAKGAVQSEVWKNRDKKWIKLDGEGEQEAAKSHR